MGAPYSMEMIRYRDALRDSTVTLATKGAVLSRLQPRWPAMLEIESFLADRQTRGLSQRTLEFYQDELQAWFDWLQEQGVSDLDDITSMLLRRWLLHLGERRNPGGVHANYRSIRAFLRWTWEESEIDTSNPISRVRPPKVPQELLEPVSLASPERC